MTENRLLDYIVTNWTKIFPRSFELVTKRPTIYGCLSGEYIGQADLLFKRGKQLYIAELKYSQQNSVDLWSSFKIIAYAKMAQLRTAKKVKPVVFLKKEIVTKDIEVLLSALGMGYATFEMTKEGYQFEFCFE